MRVLAVLALPVLIVWLVVLCGGTRCESDVQFSLEEEAAVQWLVHRKEVEPTKVRLLCNV